MLDEIWGLRDIKDPFRRALEATFLVRESRANMKEAGRIRREAVIEILQKGFTHRYIAKKLGVSHGLIPQILKGAKDCDEG